MSSSRRRTRPLLAVGHGYRSVPVLQLIEAASGWCDLLWVVDGGDPEVKTVRRVLERIGPVVDVRGRSSRDAAELVRPHRPDGVIAFRDEDVAALAPIAERLGLAFHEQAVALRLVDKLYQREALRAAGVPTPGVWSLPSPRHWRAAAKVAARMRYPVVLKPRRASGSWHVSRVENADELLRELADLCADGSADEPLLAEEYLCGVRSTNGFADYVSVESVVAQGSVSHLALTGRLPLAEPFRETGFCLPADLLPSISDAVLDTAAAAVAALGVRTGILHTEVKLTPDGPRVIEVNGRVGGGVPDMLRLAAGVDLFRVAMGVALGEVPTGGGLVPCTRVGYRFFYQPPAWASGVEHVVGLDRVGALPGVETVYLHRGPGEGVYARHGTRAYVFSVLGAALNHGAVHEAHLMVHDTVSVTYRTSHEGMAHGQDESSPRAGEGRVAVGAIG